MKALCFDIGGTFIKSGIVDENGKIDSYNKKNIRMCVHKKSVTALLFELIEQYYSDNPFDIIGISTAGVVNPQTGTIIYASDTLPGYTGTKLSEIISERYAKKCIVENDVICATTAEIVSYNHKDSFVFITLGTGIGVAIVINNKIVRGSNHMANWGGHMVIEKEGRMCTCGKIGCWEAHASVTKLLEEVMNITGIEIHTLKDAFSLQYESNQEVHKAIDAFLNYLVLGLSNIIYLFDPKEIVIGGGVSQEKSFLEILITDRLNMFIHDSYKGKTKITISTLMNDAGLIGVSKICMVESISSSEK